MSPVTVQLRNRCNPANCFVSVVVHHDMKITPIQTIGGNHSEIWRESLIEIHGTKLKVTEYSRTLSYKKHTSE